MDVLVWNLRDVVEASKGMSKSIVHVACVVVGLVLVEQRAIAEDANWSFEALIGDAYSFDSRTRVRYEVVGRLSL